MMSKKKRVLKIRKKWNINPATTVIPNKKKNKKCHVLKLEKLNSFIRSSSVKEILKYLNEVEK